MGLLALLSAPAARTERPSRTVDLALAAIFAGTASATLARAALERSLEPRVALPAALTLLVGALFATRTLAAGPTPRLLLLAALPSVLLGIGLPALASGTTWSVGATLAFAMGAALAGWSLASLGRSFSILPARRAVVTMGPYARIRHPAYAGELLMAVAAASQAGPGAFSAAAALVLATSIRALAEERLLASDPAYRAYQRRVRWRIVPWLF